MPQTENTSDLDNNGLKCVASNRKPCQFPFTYYGKVKIELWSIFDSIKSFRSIHLVQLIPMNFPIAAQKV